MTAPTDGSLDYLAQFEAHRITQADEFPFHDFEHIKWAWLAELAVIQLKKQNADLREQVKRLEKFILRDGVPCADLAARHKQEHDGTP
uniref:Uncharacterized protein n=1 Tax=viral metagenome TaxID=1070528 RepID=A0A6M3L8I5_9ZZZZ